MRPGRLPLFGVGGHTWAYRKRPARRESLLRLRNCCNVFASMPPPLALLAAAPPRLCGGGGSGQWIVRLDAQPDMPPTEPECSVEVAEVAVTGAVASKRIDHVLLPVQSGRRRLEGVRHSGLLSVPPPHGGAARALHRLQRAAGRDDASTQRDAWPRRATHEMLPP